MRAFRLVLLASATMLAATVWVRASAPAPVAIDLTGRWTGSGGDSEGNVQGTVSMTLSLTQTDNSVSGTVSTLGPNDTSCASCHRTKNGTVTGTVSGSTVTLALHFPEGGNVPSPMCVIHVNATSSSAASASVAANYVLTDSCEGNPLGSPVNGSFSMTKTSLFAEDLQAGTTAIKASHVTELRQFIDTLRARYQLGVYTWSDPSLAAGTALRGVHVTELRAALAEVYVAAKLPLPTYTDPSLSADTSAVKAAHLTEIRAAIAAIY